MTDNRLADAMIDAGHVVVVDTVFETPYSTT